MSPFIRRAAMAALLLSTGSLVVVTELTPVDAAAPRGAKAPAGPTTRPAVGVPLNDAIKAINMMDYATALTKAQLADKVDKKTPYEEYLTAKILGSIAINQPMRDFAA